MEKFLVQIEFRYNDVPKYDGDSHQYVSKTITLGVFDTRDDANMCGNKAMEVFEAKFKLNPNYNRKERFSNKGGYFGSPNDLITNLAYIRTPFDFYAKVTRLIYGDVEDYINDAMEASERHAKFKTINE